MIERSFYRLSEWMKGLDKYVGLSVMCKPERAKEISTLARDISTLYTNENIKLIPTNYENYNFKDLKWLIDYANNIFDKIDALTTIINRKGDGE